MRTAKSLGSLVLLSALAIGCSRSTDPTTAAYWVDRLGQRSERIEALKNLGRIGDPSAVPHVLAWFEREGDWQPDAAYALGQLGEKSVVPKLVAGLSFESGPAQGMRARNRSRVNIYVARALGMLGATDAAPGITRLLGSSDDRVREAALHALGELGDPANTPTVVDRALNETDPLVRLAAIRALGALGDAKGASALIQLLFVEHENLSFYDAARFALIETGGVAVPELMRTLARKNATVEAIKMPGGNAIAEGAIEAKAASVLGALRARDAAEPMAQALTRLYDVARRKGSSAPAHFAVIEIAYALGNVGGAKAVAALVPVAKDTNNQLRIAACEALTTAGDRSVTPQLIQAARTGDPQARRAALVAASRLGTGADLATFDTLAKAGDAKLPAADMAAMVRSERVRLVAAHECQTSVECWLGKLVADDPRVRERAAYELGWLGAKRAEAELLRSAIDPDAEVRMAAVLSLSRLGGSDPRQLEVIYDEWKNKHEYSGVNQELLRLIARSKSVQKRR